MGSGPPTTPGKSQVPIRFHRNIGMNPTQEANWTPSGGRFVQPSVKYVDDWQNFLGPPMIPYLEDN